MFIIMLVESISLALQSFRVFVEQVVQASICKYAVLCIV